jgi:acetyltransferase
MESALVKRVAVQLGLVVGNAKQIGVEDVLQYMDENFDLERDSRIKLLYM